MKGQKMEAVWDRERDVIADNQRVDNPLTEYAQFKHEAETNAYRAGTIQAKVNLTSLLGGYAKFEAAPTPRKPLLSPRQRAAAQFKSLSERAETGVRAIDATVEPVDGGGGADRERGVIAYIDAAAELRKLWKLLGPFDYRKAAYVVVRGHGPTAYARWRESISGKHPNGRTVDRFRDEMHDIMDRVAAHWGW